MSYDDAELVVIGAGPAGLAAAIKAKETGVDRVLVVERAEQLGGLLHQCIHNGFGLQYFGEDLTGPEYARRFISRLRELDIPCLLESMVIDLTSDRRLTIVDAAHGIRELQPKAVVLTMGCRERTRGAINIPGTRPAGVFTAGVAQRYINVEGYLPGQRVVILGSGDVGMIMARRLTLEGARVEAVVEILPYAGGLIRNEVQCLQDYDIPLLLQHTVSQIHGVDRVEGVTIAEVDGTLCPRAGTERYIPCDTLLLSVGLIPENELSRKAGIALDPVRGGPVIDERMETSVPGIFAGGNVVQVHDLADWVTTESERAGYHAARYVLGQARPADQQVNVEAGEGVRYVTPNTVSGNEEVTLYLRVKEPGKKVTLTVGEQLFTKRFKVVKPSEMVTATLSAQALAGIADRTEQLKVSCCKET